MYKSAGLAVIVSVFARHSVFDQAETTFLVATEPLNRIELSTSSLPRKCSTTELQRLSEVRGTKYEVQGLGPRSSFLVPCTSYLKRAGDDPPAGGRDLSLSSTNNCERETRFEPATYSLEGYRSTN